MTISRDPQGKPPAGGEGHSNRSQKSPYESIISQVVTKIKNEPFLFAIAVMALLIGLTVAIRTGSSDLRFMTIVIAVLAGVVILGYYLLAVLQMRAKAQDPSGEFPQVGSPTTLSSDRTSGASGASEASAPAPGKFQINASGANIGAVGDNAKVNQRLVNTLSASASGVSNEDAGLSSQQDLNVRDQLSQHRRNLSRLQSKKAVYAAGEESLSLLNQIEAEEQEIKRLELRVAKLGNNEP